MHYLDLLSRQAADVLTRVQSEESLRQAARKKDEFLATLAHELRNPLAPIRSGLELLKEAQDPGTLNKVRTVMERQTSQLILLVDDLLEMSRVTSGQLKLRPSRVSLGQVIENVILTARPLVEEAGHEMIVTMPDEPLYLNADPNRLGQVVTNLLNNASRYTPRGGKIQVELRREDNAAVMTVGENGIGIPSEMLDRIFEMFVQVGGPARPEAKGTGTGIGLALVKSLVEMHGGTVRAYSEGPDKGSRFMVRLPLAGRLPDVSTLPPPPDLSGAPLTRHRVLVVDDNADAASTMAAVVESLGQEVRVSADGQNAIATAAEFHPNVILMDLAMPKMSGYDAAGAIRQQDWGKSLTLVALTGWGYDEDRRRSHQAGFDFHLVKPVDAAAGRNLIAQLPLVSLDDER